MDAWPPLSCSLGRASLPAPATCAASCIASVTGPRGRVRRRWGAALVAAALLLPACGTINSWAGGCRAPYSGIRTDVQYIRDFGSFGEDFVGWLTIPPDMPLSAIADTLTLPVAWGFEQPPPTPVSPGCRWAIPLR